MCCGMDCAPVARGKSMDQNVSVEAAEMFRQLMKLLRPHKIEGAEKIRVGRHFDGGYIMINDFKTVEAAYSLGINDDVSWDLDIAQRGIRLFQYDHTIESLTHDHEMFNWRKIGVTGRATDGEPLLRTLPSLLEENSHLGNKNLILKCDIEGAEWDMLMNTQNSIISQFSQIVLELHSMHTLKDYGPSDAVRKALSNLYESHRVVHVHGNNYAQFGVVGGYPIPLSLEVSLARLDMGKFSASDETFPTRLDMPNNPVWADLYLGRFCFD
jgi:hypothetical protein